MADVRDIEQAVAAEAAVEDAREAIGVPPTILEVITVDGRKWEVQEASEGACPARVWGSNGPFDWVVFPAHILAQKPMSRSDESATGEAHDDASEFDPITGRAY